MNSCIVICWSTCSVISTYSKTSLIWTLWGLFKIVQYNGVFIQEGCRCPNEGKSNNFNFLSIVMTLLIDNSFSLIWFIIKVDFIWLNRKSTCRLYSNWFVKVENCFCFDYFHSHWDARVSPSEYYKQNQERLENYLSVLDMMNYDVDLGLDYIFIQDWEHYKMSSLNTSRYRSIDENIKHLFFT